MFCRNCGTQLPEGATHCVQCGYAVEQENVKETKSVSGVDVKEKIQKNRKGLLVAGAVVVVALLVIVLFVTKKTTINLNDYVTIEFSGYDTLGKATYEFDEDAFCDDYEDKVKMKKQKMDSELEELYSYLSDDMDCEILLYSCVDGKLKDASGLSNGDTVVYTWDCNDELAKENFNVKFKYKDIEVKVEGLEKAKLVNPFESINIVYTGIAPNGSVQVEKNSNEPIIKNIYFEITPNSGLKNGDEVTVRVQNAGDASYYVENYGVILAETEKTYTVEGLDCYVQGAAEISEDVLEKMKKQAEDSFYAKTAKWDERVSATNVSYIGNYFLKPKFNGGGSYNNYIYLIYKIDTTFENDMYSENVSFYYYVKFSNIMKLSDGSCSVDLSSYDTASEWNGFNHEFKWGEAWNERVTLTYPGYESIDTMFNKLVTAVVSDYEYENNVVETE
ncbi:MAG: zinc ribbon domain-containing protein [Lachnospiraceae bacterium]|nr:zinc ribbon domain-containing protein [Lachnospiraceae bacterium]MBQ6993578.1 zinc ribbon domain-containing protein [Lachnospiraceae bacterium]